MSVRRTKIPYADFTGADANFIIGCTPVSAGCLNCYARDLIEGRQRKDFSEVRLYPEKLERLKRAKFEEKGVPFRRGPGSRPIIFPVDLGDIMHPDVPTEFISSALLTMSRHEHVDWLVLTKRAKRLTVFYPLGWPPNIWPGVTVEHQETHYRAEILRDIPAQTKWVSVEPMIAPVRFVRDTMPDWVACGGESGTKRRRFDKAWASRLLWACRDRQVPFFFKQGSGRFPGEDNLLDGEIWHQLPGHYD